MALQRSFESHRPKGRRLFCDPSRSHGVATAKGLDHSPWAFQQEAALASISGNFDTAVPLVGSALDLADRRENAAAAVQALSLLTTTLAGLGDDTGSRSAGSESLRRAKEAGSQSLMTVAALTAASGLNWWNQQPDDRAALDLMLHHVADREVSGTDAMWFQLEWAVSLLGCGQPSIEVFVDCARLADQLGALHGLECALQHFALLFAEAGACREAAMLVGYLEANLRPYRMESPGHERVRVRIDEALADAEDRDVDQAIGARSSRSDIRTLIAKGVRALEAEAQHTS
jgi:hypothetical protein